jgi:anti-anti-sigma regulatory factor
MDGTGSGLYPMTSLDISSVKHLGSAIIVFTANLHMLQNTGRSKIMLLSRLVSFKNKVYSVGFQIFMAVSTKTAVFWVVHHQGDS